MKHYEYHDVNFRGTISRVRYTTTNQAGETREKYANIYLPYGYDQPGAPERYDILYLMHGGGGNPDAWLDCCKVKNMLDYAISEKEAAPLIVVFPSYYKEQISRVGPPDRDVERGHVSFFQKELTEDLLPAVEKTVRTYAADVTPEGLRSARMHRAFGGFSMGSATTWFAFTNHLDYFSRFVPLSGDCWEVEGQGGLSKPQETAKALRDCAVRWGYGADAYFIYTATGTKDFAYEPLTAQVEAMRRYPDVFVEGEDLSQGNFHYLLAEDEVHAYESVYHYLYNFLPYLFGGSGK